jgi:60 kDa SS-A/Ro ribonucleoprotein
MAKYNTKVEPAVKRTVTHQGGTGFTQKPENELIGILATGMGNNYYESEGEREKRFKEVIAKVAKVNKLFAAKALVYARSVFGQRSVSHFGAVELLPFLQGDSLGKRFFSKRNRKENRGGVIYRLDDMTEILGAYFQKNGAEASIPNSIKKGFREAIEDADAYELAKYQMKGRNVSLIDIVNLVHPHETEKNGYIDVPDVEYHKAVKGTKFEVEGTTPAENGMTRIPALRALVLGLLKQHNTVEDKNTETGKEVAEKVKSGVISKEEAAVELNEKKTENFSELIKSKKIGYLALLRNLRNILKTGDGELLDSACELLIEPKFIKKSLVWPHQIDLALEVMLLEFSGRQLAKVADALGTAYERSIPNLENLLPEGKTAVVFDTSASMQGGWKNVTLPGNKTSRNAKPVEKAALIAATFAKGVYGDVYHFANYAQKITGWNPTDSVNSLKKKFEGYIGRVGHGTQFGSCFDLFVKQNTQYDRVIIISDEQDGYGEVERAYKTYCNKFGTPYVYIINVCGYENTAPVKSGQKVFRLYGYTQDIYEKIPRLELNMNEVIDAINAIEI